MVLAGRLNCHGELRVRDLADRLGDSDLELLSETVFEKLATCQVPIISPGAKVASAV